ncbi:MAG: hypothetical protein CVV64_15110 [Candidatus Wallbacteria bacterium HGW-Wallbacteria-1]|jgi:hypothetical protein|uniref:Uncharacterized protein n=1 Tax=Candidatus Wallbacteria bacterium HGW-Wallbacteria-1 TaxID=2013854 RepID=A0A2N1PLL1_9BACT|nr:MAG: hypothetical protein CVV64_15110 [Candidatus Wallbacteria bacterium HGW-Wallbacteria-1]
MSPLRGKIQSGNVVNGSAPGSGPKSRKGWRDGTGPGREFEQNLKKYDFRQKIELTDTQVKRQG